MECLHLYLMGDKTRHIRKKSAQERQIQQLLGIIHKNNPMLLKALLDPRVVLNVDADPDFVQSPPANEAKQLIEFSFKYFQRLPNARIIFETFLKSKGEK